MHIYAIIKKKKMISNNILKKVVGLVVLGLISFYRLVHYDVLKYRFQTYQSIGKDNITFLCIPTQILIVI